MFAVVETGSKQYLVKAGDVIKVERIEGEVGASVKLDKIHALGTKVGADVPASAKVVAEVVEHKRNDKEIIFKKKRRHNYRRKRGHRQQITVLRIKEVNA